MAALTTAGPAARGGCSGCGGGCGGRGNSVTTSFWQPVTIYSAVSSALALYIRSYLSANDMAAAAIAGLYM